jgi:uncharacterized protein
MHTGHALQRGALVPLCAILLASAVHGQEIPLRPPEITAAGHGQGRATPTSAVVFISVTTKAPTAAQAASENATRSASTVTALRSAGLASGDVTTSGYMVGQNFEYPPQDPRFAGGQRVPAGFLARNTIRAEVRRISDVGKIIDASLTGGANEVAGVQFISSDEENARRDATAAAVREARTTAEVIARAAGGSLGRLLSLSSGGMNPMYQYDNYNLLSSAPAAPTTILAPDLTVNAQVVGRWEFVPGTSR